jgi:8-oxo-dGTP pyrophosphatase MutT (NUDIX family)
MTERNETSAGGVVYRWVDERIDVLLAEQRDRLTGEGTTRLPKGSVEAGETPEQAAIREVREETGLAARVAGSIGTVHYTYREAEVRVAKEVHFFLMEPAPADPRPRDGEMERVYWCPIDEASGRLTFETERSAVDRARERLRDLPPR